MAFHISEVVRVGHKLIELIEADKPSMLVEREVEVCKLCWDYHKGSDGVVDFDFVEFVKVVEG